MSVTSFPFLKKISIARSYGGGGKKRDNNHQISIFGFKCIAINIEDFINDLYSISGL
jgi:hypothetical protein